jgi:hypothetical protein
MKLIKIYNANRAGRKKRLKEEVDLLEQGYKVESEEEIKSFEGGFKACCLAVFFLPLLLFCYKKRVKVVYVKEC